MTDSDQAWILGELIRCLEHENSGAVDFQDIDGACVRDGAAKSSLRTGDEGRSEVAARYDQLIAFAGMRLSRRLGVGLCPALTRTEVRSPGARTQALAESLANDGVLSGSLRVPHAAADILLTG